MNPRLLRVTAAQVIRVLEELGFMLTRQSGSHKIYKNAASKRVTVPFHPGKILHPKVLKSVLSDAGLMVKKSLRTKRSLRLDWLTTRALTR